MAAFQNAALLLLTFFSMSILVVRCAAVEFCDRDGPAPLCDEIEASWPLPSTHGALSVQYYRRASELALGQQGNDAKVALIMVHGTGRNADQYLCWASAASPSDVFVIAPKFAIGTDKRPENNTIYWDENTQWKGGDPSSQHMHPRVSSFQVLDDIIIELAETLPKLEQIVLAGHSAGGQVAVRYALGTRVDAKLGNKNVQLHIVPANPSTYPYLDETRPVMPKTTCHDYCVNTTIPKTRWTFQVPSATARAHCKDYNLWKYGMVDLNPYMNQSCSAPIGDDDIEHRLNCVERFIQRPTRYLLGDADVCNEALSVSPCATCDSHDIDYSCEAMVGGNCRLQRGFIYVEHVYDVQRRLVQKGAYTPEQQAFNHGPITVSNVGHDACRMFTSSTGKRALFDFGYSRLEHGGNEESEY